MRPLLPACLILLLPILAHAQPIDGLVPRFDPETSGLVLERPTQSGAFFDVLGREAGAFGYENRPFEVWTYPLKLISDFRLAFEIEDYNYAVDGLEAMAHIEVRPEATVLTYRHAAFTVRQILFAPVDEPGLVMLLDVDTVRPLRVIGSFREDLRLMWPAGLMTGNLFWDAEQERYGIIEESQRFAGVVGGPGIRDVSVMPYQEEPRDAPTRFVLNVQPEVARDYLFPLVVAGSVEGLEGARATHERLLADPAAAYRQTVRYYQDLLDRTTSIDTPDDRLDRAFAWAKIGTDKGLVTNPYLGTGFVAGYRTAGDSERPGFAWYFGRDALWTTFALIAYGDYAAARTALDFLKQFQREDGKIPHEVSQSASLLDWFEHYPYPWASADATPLFILAHADYWQATGDLAYLRANWDALKQAFRFTAATDTDDNDLIENTNVGHGWIEGGELHPAHEEIYMQGLWIAAARSIATLAGVLQDDQTAALARDAADRTKAAMESTYWADDRGYYAYSSPHPSDPFYAEDTVLPAVPMWWGVLDDERAQRSIDHLGAGALATDWGTRILASTSSRYDPLSYHNGSVWPLFTGWASMGAYRYDRPHVGYQALMANALLTEQDALGYVTELLSGDYNTAFGRSSHHQVWSEAMVITPALRGLFGIEPRDGGRTLRLAPQPPSDWDAFTLTDIRAGAATYDVTYRHGPEALHLVIDRLGPEDAERFEIAPALPLDATVQSVAVNGQDVPFEIIRRGDVQRVVITATPQGARTEVVIVHTPGTRVYLHHEPAGLGATNQGLRLLRARPDGSTLHLVAEGRGGQTYPLYVRSPHQVGPAGGVTVTTDGAVQTLSVPFDGPADAYVRRDFRLPLR